MAELPESVRRRGLLKRAGGIGIAGIVGSAVASSTGGATTTTSDPEWTETYVDECYEEDSIGVHPENKYKMRHALSVAYFGASYNDEKEAYAHTYGLTSALVARFDDASTPEEYIRAGANNSLKHHSLELDVDDPALELYTSTDEENLGLNPAEGTDSNLERAVEPLIDLAIDKIKAVTIGNLETAYEVYAGLTYTPDATDDWRNEKTIAADYDPGHTWDSYIYLEPVIYSDVPCENHPFTVRTAGENYRFKDANPDPDLRGTSNDVVLTTEAQVDRRLC